MEILKLYPAYKNYIWGGEKLAQRYGKTADFTPVAESWELSFHKDGQTRVADGRTLAEVLTPAELGKACESFPFFPMLIKFIDAKQNLSVQVHPDDAYALAHENSFGKTEMWYVVEADEGAGLYVGFSRDVTREEYERAIADGTLCDLLNFYPVQKGECYFIPAGTIHAIGAGCVICEIQQNSNLTYRVFDYGRVGADGKPRELHVAKALAVTDLKKYEKLDPLGGECGTELLGSCPYFHVTRQMVRGKWQIETSARSFKCITCVEGVGQIEGQPISRGDSFFIPANFGTAHLSGDMVLICAEVQ